MGIYKNILNVRTGQFNLVSNIDGVTFKNSVALTTNLPATNNKIGDAIIVEDTGNFFIWDGEQWISQGKFIKESESEQGKFLN